MACSGSMVSSIRSRPTLASHALNGSAFGEGTDWIIRNSCSVLATSVLYLLPSEDSIFSCTIFSYNSTAPSFFSFRFKSLQYRRGFSVPVKTEITSTMEKYHSSCSSSHAVRIFLSSNSWIASVFINSPIAMYLSFAGIIIVYRIFLKKSTSGLAQLISRKAASIFAAAVRPLSSGAVRMLMCHKVTQRI